MLSPKDVQRFFEKVELKKDSGCLEWTAGLGVQGYGRFKLAQPRRTEFAHRVAWQIANGPIPAGLFVLHKCDNRKCVNAKHLFLGTQKDNQQDMKKKGRHVHGERSPNSKLTEQQVLAIYKFYEHEKSTLKVAAKFGITKNLAWRIVKGLQWEHLYKTVYK